MTTFNPYNNPGLDTSAAEFERQAVITNADRLAPAPASTAPAAEAANAVVVEEHSALAGINPAFGDADPEADLSDMPRLRSLAHELPSARFVIKAKLAEVAALAPEGLDESGFDITNAADTLAGVSDLITAAEDFLITQAAADPEDMVTWLLGKDETALMAAFSHAAEHLGN